MAAVTDGGAAANATPQPLAKGDVITRAGDADIAGMVDLLAEVRNRQAGDTLELTVQRGGEAVARHGHAGGGRAVGRHGVRAGRMTGRSLRRCPPGTARMCPMEPATAIMAS